MTKGFPPVGTFLTRAGRNDAFLLVLLAASLSLNVYLGWSVKRLKGVAAVRPPETVVLTPGVTVGPVSAVSLSGKRQETIGYAETDKPTVFYVFSPSCVWCERNTQNINLVADQTRDSFRFIGLSLSDDGLQEYVTSHRFNFPVYTGVAPESAQMLGLGSTPQTIVISPDGRVQQNWVGAYASMTQPQVEGFFNVRLPGLTPPKK